MDMVCWRLYWGLGYCIAGVRHGEFEACCIAYRWSARDQRRASSRNVRCLQRLWTRLVWACDDVQKTNKENERNRARNVRALKDDLGPGALVCR